jgi:amino acid adenylation domain-containing protein
MRSMAILKDADSGAEPLGLSALRRFEARAEEAPSALALAAGQLRLAYGELDAEANRLARVLRAEGIGPSDLVALALPRGPELVIAAVAVWKAGAAYLPLDDKNPDERLLFTLKDADARVLLTLRGKADVLRGPWTTIALDVEARRIARESPDRVVDGAATGDLAYVIYTSGSTGRPKGVEVAHGSLENLIEWHVRTFRVRARDRMTQVAGAGFDASVWEIWPALAAGASLHFPDEMTRVTPELLRDWLVEERITVSFLPTPLAEAVLALPWPEETALRVLLTGADTLHRHPPASLPFVLVNNYGPTEATVVATSGVVPPGRRGQPSIGQPIDGVVVRILDEARNELPDGVAGELCIGGRGLARGYRGRPVLTAERFIDDPCDPGARLYRTGDVARFLPDGSLAFLGRRDGELKIRGHRIDADEIVTVLDAQPDIAASAVSVHEDAAGARLVAYLTPRNGAVPSSRELARLLAAKLPAAMLPDAYVLLRALPLTPNGKLDRAALPPPSAANLLPEGGSRPRNGVEERLLGIVASLLGVPDVALEDNFFLVGGHSMLGTQLIARVRDAFGVELSLRTLFDAPTVAALAREVESLIAARVEEMSEEEAREILQETPAPASVA